MKIRAVGPAHVLTRRVTEVDGKEISDTLFFVVYVRLQNACDVWFLFLHVCPPFSLLTCLNFTSQDREHSALEHIPRIFADTYAAR